jgi:hypothetical protein
MAIKFLTQLAYFYYWTWYLWPFVFVFSFVKGLSLKIKDEESSAYKKSLIMASLSLLVILAGITGLQFT